MSRDPYQLTMPKARTTAAVFASPHSGCDYPWSFIRASQLDEKAIRSSEDAFVDQLFSAAPDYGAPLLASTVPRAYVDLNRNESELDPALIEGVRQTGHNPRISSGLGVIPRVVANGREIRQGKIGIGEAMRRLDECYHPYHNKLTTLMNESVELFGFALLFDCHSMPHEALAVTSYAFDQRPEIVLGDRFGAACAPELIEEVDRAFQDAGLRTSRNLPFAGAHVTQNYGRPTNGHHAIQIEVDRGLYMDEAEIEPNENFDAFKTVLSHVIGRLSELGQEDIRLAAQ